MDNEKLKFPVELLPDSIKNFATEISRESKTPIEMAYHSCIGAISTALNGAVGIRTTGKFVEPGLIWNMTIAEPGERKGVGRLAYDPIINLETQAQRVAQKAITNYKDTIEPIKAALTRRLKTAVEKQEADSVIEEIKNKIKELPKQPIYPTYVTDDTTVEAMAEQLKENDEAMTIMDTEGTYFLVISGLYNNGKANLGFVNKGHDMERASSKRKGGGGINLDGPAITHCLLVQPLTLTKLQKNPDFVGTGFAQRFLISYPKTLLGGRDHDDEYTANQEIINDWNLRITKLFEFCKDLKSRSISKGKDGLSVIDMDPQAKELYQKFLKSMEPRFKPGGDFSGQLGGWGSKLPGRLARIALFYETFDNIMNMNITQTLPTVVSAKYMEMALGKADYYIEQAKAVWQVITGVKTIGREEDYKQKIVMRWIIEKSVKLDNGATKPFTASDIHRTARDWMNYPFKKDKVRGTTEADDIQNTLEEMVIEYKGELLTDEVQATGLLTSSKGGRPAKYTKFMASAAYAKQLYEAK